MSRERLRQPPSTLTGELGQYVQEIWKAVNAIPNISMFSGIHPTTSGVTGVAGNLVVNIGSASNVSRLFQHFGSAVIPDKTSWRTIA